MRASNPAWVLLALALAGCGPKESAPEAVVIDWARIAPASAGGTVVPGMSSTVPGAQVSIPAVTSLPPAADGLEAAWAKANQHQVDVLQREQEMAATEPLRAFRAAQLAEAERKVQERKAELAEERESDLNAFAQAVRRHGDNVGWDRVELAWMAGFPDPDPKSERKPTGRYGFRQIYLDDAAKLRTDIRTKEEAFDSAWGKRMAQSEARRVRQLDDLRLSLNAEVERATQAEAQRMKKSVDQKQVQIALPTKPADLPTATFDSRTATFPAASASLPEIKVPSASDPVALAKARLPVFLAQNKFRLAGPGEKGRDATGEFLKWLKQFELGG